MIINRSVLVLALLLCSLGTLSAQQLEIYQKSGSDSISAKKHSEWTVYGDREGIWLHVKYNQFPRIEEPKMYLFIDKRTPLGEYEEYDTYKLEVPDTASSIKRLHHFKTVGDYAVSYTDADKQVVVTDTLRLRYDQQITFATDVKRGQPIGILNEVEPSSTGLYYYKIHLSGSRRLQTHQIIMQVYRHDGEGFNEHIGEYKNYVNHSSNYATFRGLFLDPGTYKFSTYKFNGEPYAEGFLVLKPLEKNKK